MIQGGVDGDLFDSTGWSGLMQRLPAGLDVDASARMAGAFARARGVPDAGALLRLALIYGTTPLSLRSAAAWAGVTGLARLSDVALMYRLQSSEAWLSGLLAETLSAAVPAPSDRTTTEGRLRIVDATMIGSPARDGSWRVHATYSLEHRRFTGFELTDRRGAESLERAAVAPGDIVLADRFYAKPGQVHHIAASGADFIVRRGLTGASLRHANGGKLDIKAVMAAVEHGQTTELSVRVPLPPGSDAPPLPARLVVVHLGDKAEAARARMLRKAALKQQPAKPKRVEAAGFVMLLTSLDAIDFPAERVAALYRLRWQIEIAFKRLKSLIGLADLQAKEPRLARCCLFAKLLLAALIEDCLAEILDSSPCAQ